MGKGDDFKIVILGCSVLCLLAWHVVVENAFISFGVTNSMQEVEFTELTITQVSPEKLYDLDYDDTTNAPFNYSKLKLNSVSAELLETIPGIGSSLASRIVEFRSNNGEFANLDSLIEISGVGGAKLKILKQYTRL